jgi:hypothetical protein
MLKRDGKPLSPLRAVPGFSERLDEAAFASYHTAFATIQRGYSQIENVKKQLNQLRSVQWERPLPKPFATFNTPDGKQWNAVGILVGLPRSQVLLCKRSDENEWAVVQRLKSGGSYAQSHGDATVLLGGHNNPRGAAEEYIGQAEHTLRFMARNLTAKAQEVVWEKYPDNNPSQVMRAISERCALAVDNPEALRHQQKQNIERSLKQSRGMSI